MSDTNEENRVAQVSADVRDNLNTLGGEIQNLTQALENQRAVAEHWRSQHEQLTETHAAKCEQHDAAVLALNCRLSEIEIQHAKQVEELNEARRIVDDELERAVRLAERVSRERDECNRLNGEAADMLQRQRETIDSLQKELAECKARTL